MPLYVFEPRYRAMLSDVLNGGRRIAMGLSEGGAGAVRTVCGVGVIVRHQRQPDGTSHILLWGEIRGRILSQEPTGSYLTVQVERLREVLPPPGSQAAAAHRERLLALLREGFGRKFPGEGGPLLSAALKQRPGLGALADFAAATFLQAPRQRQEVLETLDVLSRAERVAALLKRSWGAGGPPPPSVMDPGRASLN
jgi:ATP-dependent Lon protease